MTVQNPRLVVVAEGAVNNAQKLIEHFRLNRLPPVQPAPTILGHVCNAALVSASDRMLATRLGEGAVKALIDGKNADLVGIRNNHIVTTPLKDIVGRQKTIDLRLFELAQIMAQ